MSERAIGRHLCCEFALVPPGSDPGFADAVLDVCSREGVDAVLPQSSFGLEGLAGARERFEIPVLVSSPETIQRCNDKAETYALLKRLGLAGPDFRRGRGARGAAEAAGGAGYSERAGCLQPGRSPGPPAVPVPRPRVGRP